MTSRPDESLTGQTVSHYEILEELGRGGVAVVYKARDVRLDRVVALKFLELSSTDEAGTLRFVREAKTASALVHPRICTIYDIDQSDDQRLFIAMAYCDGRTLKQLILDGPLAVDQALDIAVQIGEALVVAHEQGVIHRDVKPGNVMVDRKGAVTLLDFGLAKSPEASPITSNYSVLGTAAYMAPEQASGRPLDHRCDLWALGATLYEMLAGVPPFQAPSLSALLIAISQDEPLPLRQRRAELPMAVERLVARCLVKDRAARVQSAAELVEELRARLAELRPRLGESTAPTPDQSIRGNLRSMRMGTLLAWLSDVGRSGTLVVDNGRVEKRIVFHRGVILSTASTDPKEFLGHFLVAHGFITELDLTRAMEMQEATGDLLGKNLVALGAIGQAELERMLLVKAEETIYEVLAWDQGEFSFIAGLPQAAMIPMALDIPELIAEANRRQAEWAEIARVIPTPLAIPVSVVDLLADDDLGADERQILRFVDDRNTVAEVCLFAHASEYHTCRILFRMWQAGKVKVVVPRAAHQEAADELSRLPDVRASVVLENARQRLERRDFAGALRCLHTARSLEPDNARVKQQTEHLKGILQAAILAEGIGPKVVPALERPASSLISLDLSPQEGFILSRIDGTHAVEELLKVSPIPPLEVLVVLWKLWSAGHIRLS